MCIRDRRIGPPVSVPVRFPASHGPATVSSPPHRNLLPVCDILEFSRMWKRVDWERIRMLQFVRFQKAARTSIFDYAEKLLKSLSSDAYLAKVGTNQGFILMHSTGSLPNGSAKFL